MASAEIIGRNQYLDYVDLDRVPDPQSFLVERHRPHKFRVAYHNHASVEVNFLDGCEMDYSMAGKPVHVPQHRMTVFWGAVPHCVTNVDGTGVIVNVYLSLPSVVRWGLPTHFLEALLGGHMVCCSDANPHDRFAFNRWADDYREGDRAWRELILGEIEMRFRRMVLEGQTALTEAADGPRGAFEGSTTVNHVSEMLRYIADNYGSSITIADVAGHVNISSSYAMSLFRRVVGIPIKEHITRIRLSHAQTLLATSEMKIVSIAMDSGFGSLSSFYDAFQVHAHMTPAAFRKEARRLGSEATANA